LSRRCGWIDVGYRRSEKLGKTQVLALPPSESKGYFLVKLNLESILLEAAGIFQLSSERAFPSSPFEVR
jgi:hypothetical protein